ncbi:MAG: aminotransferase class I/II-fold pyridoxal phosphate-dependent enzyme [Clostridia bacterium]|nr:aminotransferase class I/II-fold pyridoxal phosphate-dependent enzyme [Clostridia bacterium]
MKVSTPISDFLDGYAADGTARFHMPGHKGKIPEDTFAKFDITEIPGADSLYEADGIIKKSEENARSVFGSEATFYSTEGSSHCIRAMVYIAGLYAASKGLPNRILAIRNAHKSFVTAAGLAGAEADWILPKNGGLLSGDIDLNEVESALKSKIYSSLFVTSPDYPGKIAGVRSLSEICNKYGVLLLVDNAHGAYLRFLPHDLHPVTNGADICCDSAHKTLPVLTGGAYLHFGKNAKVLAEHARSALSLFGSTSPSYLILRSLDRANAVISGDDWKQEIARCAALCENAKGRLAEAGYGVYGDEPLKITLLTRQYGYSGAEVLDFLRKAGFALEYADNDIIVAMVTPFNTESEILLLCEALAALPKRDPLPRLAPEVTLPKRAMSIREALFAESEEIPVADAYGRICAAPTVSCPPAVPCAVCGEIIDENVIANFKYHGVKKILAVRK